MFKKLREPFGKAGLTVAIVALVLAMVAGAYAAGALSGKEKKEVEKIARKFQGSGPEGKQGPPGAPGTNGSSGTPGESVAVSTLGKNSECKEGGAKFTNATGTAKACNGEAAAGGSYPSTLPSGKTETGVWAYMPGELEGSNEAEIRIPLSFSVPLEAPLPGSQTEVLGPNATPTVNCPGTVEAPTAKKGELCVYSQRVGGGPQEVLINNPATSDVEGAATSGAALTFEFPEESARPSSTKGWGTWAVTAE